MRTERSITKPYKVYWTCEQGSRIQHLWALNQDDAANKCREEVKRKYRMESFRINKITRKNGEIDNEI